MPVAATQQPQGARAIERVRCSTCGRSWAVYQGATPRMWTLCAGRLYCDRRACNAALEQARLALRSAAPLTGSSVHQSLSGP